MAAGYWDVILITFVGFVALAAMLLVPVWRFLSREEEVGDGFSDEVKGHAKDDVSSGGPAWVNDLKSPSEDHNPPS